MSENVNTVLILIKPDAILRGLVGQILSRFEQRGYWINAVTTKFKNKKALESLFDEDYGCSLTEAVDRYFGNPIIGFLLHGIPPERVEKIVGNRVYPGDCHFGSIREEFGLDLINNSVSVLQEDKFDVFYSNDNDHDPRREDQ